jgi:hypothetical protein
LTHNVLSFSIRSKNKQILRSPYSETQLEGGNDGTEGTGSSLVRVRVEGNGIAGDDFVINKLEIRTRD